MPYTDHYCDYEDFDDWNSGGYCVGEDSFGPSKVQCKQYLESQGLFLEELQDKFSLSEWSAKQIVSIVVNWLEECND